MTAVRQIEDAFKAGKLELVTSREAWRKQNRAQDKSLRLAFEQDRTNVPVVLDDHRLIGFHHQQDHLGGFTTNPIVKEAEPFGMHLT